MTESTATAPATSTPPPSALATMGGIDLSAAFASATALGKDGIEVLERLYVIAEKERAAAAKTASMRAMSAFLADMPIIKKAVEGAHKATVKGTRTAGLYAPIDLITPILNPVAAKHGFSYRFSRRMLDGKDYIDCIISHEGGHEYVGSTFPCPPDTGPGRSAVQAMGSGESYAKRYALIAAFAITCADPDTDGANGHDADCVTVEQEAKLAELIDATGSDKSKFLTAFRAENLSRVLASDYPKAKALLDKKLAEKGRRA